MRNFLFPILLLISCSGEKKKAEPYSVDQANDSIRLLIDRAHTDSLYKVFADGNTRYLVIDSCDFLHARLLQNFESGNEFDLEYNSDAVSRKHLITDAFPDYMYSIAPAKIGGLEHIQLNGRGSEELVVLLNGYFERNNGADFRVEEDDEYFVFDVDADSVIF